MTGSRKKLITASVLILGIAVLIVAAITFQRPLRERYWLWKLETGNEEEQLEAAVNLSATLPVGRPRVRSSGGGVCTLPRY